MAEQVEKVNRDLVAHDADGKPYSVRYEAVNAMMLNEFLKEHPKNEETANNYRAAAKANRCICCRPAEGKRAARSEYVRAANGPK